MTTTVSAQKSRQDENKQETGSLPRWELADFYASLKDP